jgi:hypothetical protein
MRTFGGQLREQGRRVVALVRRPAVLSGILLVLACVVFVAHPTLAQTPAPAQPPAPTTSTFDKWIVIAFGAILRPLVSLFGSLLLSAVGMLTAVAQFNNFVNAKAVTTGWVIVRDLANMFFILVLLIMAFGTMLGVDQYSYKNKALTRLLLMAVIINFTRTICGILIDFGQVVMLTFVNGFKEAAGGNFTSGFAIDKILLSNPGAPSNITDATSIVTSMCLALVMVVASLVIVLIFVFTLLIRIIYLWCLVILSPIAFLMKAVPSSKASSFYAKWWSLFTENVVVGPVLAFFLWLSLLVMSGDGGITSDWNAQAKDAGSGSSAVIVGVSAAGAFDTLYQFVIAIALLLGGWKVTKEVGGAAVGFGSQLFGTAAGAARKSLRYGYRGAKAVGGVAAGAAVAGVSRLPAGSGTTVGSRLELAADNFRKGRFGRTLGLDKDYTERRQEERRIATLRATGKDDRADALQQKLNDKRAGDFISKYNTEGLRKLAFGPEGQKLDKTDQQAVLLALAKKGDDTLKGKGAELTNLVAAVGGSTDFEAQVRGALKDKGDKRAFYGFGGAGKVKDQIRERFRSAGKGGLNEWASEIRKSTSLDKDDQPAARQAVDELLELDSSQYTLLNDRNKQEVNESLLLAVQNEKDAQRSIDLQAQYHALTGSDYVTDEPRARELKDEQDKKLAGARVDLKKKGQYKEKPRDAALRRILGSNELTTTTDDVYDRVDKLQADLAGGAPLDPVKVADIMNDLRGKVSTAGSGFSGEFDENGIELTNLQVLEGSTAYQNLDAANRAAATGDAKDVEKLLQDVRTDLGGAISGRSRFTRIRPKDLAATAKLEREVRSGIEAARAGLISARQETEPKARIKAAIAAARKGIASIKELEALPVPPSPEIRNDLYALGQQLKELKKNAKTDSQAAISARIESINDLVDKFSKEK